MPRCSWSINLQVDGGARLNSTGVVDLDSVEMITKSARKASDKANETTTPLRISGDRDSIDLLAITADGAPVTGKPVTLRQVVKQKQAKGKKPKNKNAKAQPKRKPRELKLYDNWDEAGRIYRGDDAKAMFDMLKENKLVIDNKRPNDVTLQVVIGRKF